MPPFLSKLASFFTYKEPANKELGFELLEDANEGNGNKNQQDAAAPVKQGDEQASPDSARQPPKNGGRKRQSVAPLSVDQWARKKKAERGGQDNGEQSTLRTGLQVNLDVIRNRLHFPENMDVVIREFKVGRKLKAFLVFLENMVDKKQLNLTLLPQLMANDVFGNQPNACPVDYLIENVIAMYQVTKTNQYHEAVTVVLSGGSVLFMEGCGECILIKTFGAEKRAVEKPATEPVIKGAQEGFTESMDTNISLIRKIIRNENLIVKFVPVGNTNHSSCAVIYLDGVANASVVAEVMKRVERIHAGYIQGAGFVEQFIEDNPHMLFPQMLNTERPDRAASFIMDGLVAVIAEGTPRAIAAPCSFFRLMHTSEDTSLRWPYGTFLRLIRYLGLITSIFLPGMYVALILFHTEMLPTEILISIAAAKEMVPFPTLVEVMLLELSFEMVREGAIRVPSVIGQTLGIVGALILGQAAVSANLVNPVTVIVVSLTSIGSFTIPNYELGLAMRVSRFVYILAGAALGFYGISVALCLTFLLACSMKSFGVPFFAPVAPKTKATKDTVIRSPIYANAQRPDALNTPNRTCMGNNVENWTKKDPAGENGGGS